MPAAGGGPHGWTCVTEPPHQSKDHQLTDADHAVLLGSALAQSLQDGVVKPSEAETIARDVQQLIDGGEGWQYGFAAEEPLWTLNHYSAALADRWEQAGDPPAAVPALAAAAPPAQDLQRSDS